MKTLRNFIDKHPVIGGGVIFGLLSLVCNGLWIMFFDMAHLYDIMHAIPTALIYNPIINRMGGMVRSEWLFVPLAIGIDFLVGMLLAAVLRKGVKDQSLRGLYLIGAFIIYWIVICYQWLPII